MLVDVASPYGDIREQATTIEDLDRRLDKLDRFVIVLCGLILLSEASRWFL